MIAIKSKNTKPERALGKAMWSLGLRYRKHYKLAVGIPDFAFPYVKLAVFCDGDFWHGNNWKLRGLSSIEEELSTYSEFWANKIKRNIRRDLEVNKELYSEGWVILRFWESEIKNDANKIAQEVLRVYKDLRLQKNDF